VATYVRSEEQKGAVQHASNTVEEAKAFAGVISERTSNNFSASVDLRGRVQRASIAMVCAALGIGYVVGGGLFAASTSGS
jgi:hypothetical protein